LLRGAYRFVSGLTLLATGCSAGPSEDRINEGGGDELVRRLRQFVAD